MRPKMQFAYVYVLPSSALPTCEKFTWRGSPIFATDMRVSAAALLPEH
jgi:hypothetical protein